MRLIVMRAGLSIRILLLILQLFGFHSSSAAYCHSVSNLLFSLYAFPEGSSIERVRYDKGMEL